MPGIHGWEGEPDTRTCVIEGQRLTVDMFNISRWAGRADGGGVDVSKVFENSDAVIAILQPAKPSSFIWLDTIRFNQSKTLIDEQKAKGSLTETAVVLIWHEDEASGMTAEEQREIGRQKAELYAAKAGGDVEIYFAHAFSGVGVDQAVEGTVARVMQRKRAGEAQTRKSQRPWSRFTAYVKALRRG